MSAHTGHRVSSPALGALAGLGMILAVVVADGIIGGRIVPVTAVLLGGLVASAVAGPAVVAGVVAVATATAWLLGLQDGIPTDELSSRIALVGLAGLFSCGVAGNRTRREASLAKANRAAALNQTLLRGLLPSTAGVRSVDAHVLYRPGHRDLLVGGDFVDVLELDDGRTAFCVGDVSGHGPVAAALGTALRAGWRTQALTEADPAQWLAAMDRLLGAEASSDEQFATVLVGYVAAGEVVFANAGHPRPVLLGDSAEVLALHAGPPLGAAAGADDWPVQHSALPERTWGIAMYTDGLIEGRAAAGSADRLGEQRLVALLDELLRPYDARLEEVARRVEAANGAPLPDDVALVMLRLSDEVQVPRQANAVGVAV